MRRFIIFVLALLVVVVAIGIYRDWFNFGKQDDPGSDKTRLSVEVDKRKIEQDAEALKQQAKELGQRANIDTGNKEETATGTVSKVDSAAQRLMIVTSDNKELTVNVDASTKLRAKDGPMSLNDLRAGERVTVVYSVKDGKKIAQSVTAQAAG